ncbi:MAG: hypothetical protein V1698_00650, partial [bacterium]
QWKFYRGECGKERSSTQQPNNSDSAQEKPNINTPENKPVSSVSPKQPACIQVITPAKNPRTGECKNFPTPCDIPAGWMKVANCGVNTPAETTNNAEQNPVRQNQTEPMPSIEQRPPAQIGADNILR